MMSAEQLQQLCAHEWLHAFEEDADGVEVYRPADADVPASRRPRERLRLLANGAASVRVGGPDDRSIAHNASWQQDGDAVTVQITSSPSPRATYRIVSIAKNQLRVRVS